MACSKRHPSLDFVSLSNGTALITCLATYLQDHTPYTTVKRHPIPCIIGKGRCIISLCRLSQNLETPHSQRLALVVFFTTLCSCHAIIPLQLIFGPIDSCLGINYIVFLFLEFVNKDLFTEISYDF